MNIDWKEFGEKVYGMTSGASLGRISEREKGYADEESKFTALDVIMPAVRTVTDCGRNFTPADIAEHYADSSEVYSEEFAYFKRNYNLGLYPPYSGTYDNIFKNNFAGVLRAGYWGTLAPANPALAVKTASSCRCIEAGEEVFEAEKFFAAAAALAYSSGNSMRKMKELIAKSAEYTDEESTAAEIVADVQKYFEEKRDDTADMIKIKYGSVNKKDYRQNLAVTVAALLFGEGDIEKTVEYIKKTNIGYREYEISMAGEILGIITGNQIDKKYHTANEIYGFDKKTFAGGKKIPEIAAEISLSALLFETENKKCSFKEAPVPNAPAKGGGRKIYFAPEYENGPCIKPGEAKKIKFSSINGEKMKGTVTFVLPDGFTAKKESVDFRTGILPANPEIVLLLDKSVNMLRKKNIIKMVIRQSEGDVFEQNIGIVGAEAYEIYGPFTEEYDAKKDLSRFMTEKGGKEKEFADYYGKIYSASVNPESEIMEKKLTGSYYGGGKSEGEIRNGRIVFAEDSILSAEKFTGYDGPCIIYLRKKVYSEKSGNVRIEIGCSDVFRLWQDDKLLAYSEESKINYGKNIIICDELLKKGDNIFTVKLVRRNGRSDFSMTFFDDLTGERVSEIVTDTGTYFK